MPRLITVIMPALNEAQCIKALVASVPVSEFGRRGYDSEVLVVDNGSSDGTGDLAKEAGARVVYQPARGYGHAYLAGFKAARGEIICTLDADGTYPPSILPDFVERLLKEDLDFINTNRFTFMTDHVMSKTNRLGNSMLTVASRALFRVPFRDSQSGMWVFRARLLDRMKLRSSGMALSQEIKIEAWRAKAACTEIPIHYTYRCGQSKLRVWRDGVGNLAHLLHKRLELSASRSRGSLPKVPDPSA